MPASAPPMSGNDRCGGTPSIRTLTDCFSNRHVDARISADTAHDSNGSAGSQPVHQIRVQGAWPLGRFVGQAEGVAGNLVQADDDNLRRRVARATQPEQRAEPGIFLETKNGRDMSGYREQLDRAIESIVGKTEEKGVESLFTRGGTALATCAGRDT